MMLTADELWFDYGWRTWANATSAYIEYPFVPQQMENCDELKAKFKMKQKRTISINPDREMTW